LILLAEHFARRWLFEQVERQGAQLVAGNDRQP
jgi:hypothetical protein